MSSLNIDREHGALVLIVDDVPDNLAVLHDALDESGFTVLVANHGEAALQRAYENQPDIILLDAVMPGMDGFEVCRELKADLDTRNIPVIFMTGLTEAEHVVAAFEAGGADYVTKPVRPVEVLARIAAHLKTSRLMHQARSALDAYGQATIAVTPANGRILWQTPLARQWLQNYFPNLEHAQTPPALFTWMRAAGGQEAGQPLTLVQAQGRLIFSMADNSSDEQWVILISEESDAAQIEALMLTLRLTMRESEVLYWASKGKTNRDIGEILGTSPRTVNKHLEHIYVKLGVETRTAAAAVASGKIRMVKG